MALNGALASLALKASSRLRGRERAPRWMPDKSHDTATLEKLLKIKRGLFLKEWWRFFFLVTDTSAFIQ